MIYLDNSATTKQDALVTERMIKCMEETYGNPSSLHRMGLDAEKMVKRARKEISDAAGIPGVQVVFTSGGTEADNMAIFGAAKAGHRRGRRIVTSAVEHPAVLESCAALEREGFEVVRVGVDRQGRLDLAAAEAAIDDQTILVTMMQVNNESGTIFPIDDLAQIIQDRKAPAILHCDAVQSFGKISLPREADLISISGHKIHGPKGSGALLMRKDLQIPAYIHGGGQEKGFRSGTENVPAIAGLGAASSLCVKDRRGRMEKIAALRNRLLAGLRQTIPDILINSPQQTGEEAGDCCASLLNVSFLGTRGEVLLHSLEQEGICVSTGSACSSNKKGRSHVLQAMGRSDKEIEGAIRFSLSGYNTQEEIEETIEKTAAAVQRFRRLGSFR
ncbi:MAG: cysteine desulfurase [Firmicutes bacterium]|nr:cysteine desulfurase [Bacillota bacterium]